MSASDLLFSHSAAVSKALIVCHFGDPLGAIRYHPTKASAAVWRCFIPLRLAQLQALRPFKSGEPTPRLAILTPGISSSSNAE